MAGKQLDLDTGTAAIFIRDLPRGVKDQFKAYCARRQYSMKNMIIKLMRQCIENDNIARIEGVNQKRLRKEIRKAEKDGLA